MDPITSPAAQGDYRGDFTRDTFAPLQHFTRVLMQQGRVQLDADWNEQVSILLHLTRTLAADLLGQHAGTKGAFAITANPAGQLTDLNIAPGHYYVDGVLVENAGLPDRKPYTYYGQPHLIPLKNMDPDKLPTPPFVIYLDVWERHVTDFDVPSVREVALGGPDTATRAEVIWQVRWHKALPGSPVTKANLQDDKWWANLTGSWWRGDKAAMRAWVAALQDPTEVEPCAVPPDAGYRGPENQLYRVEIHTGGNADTATFKWSRNNASEFYPVVSYISGQELSLEHLGRDDRSALSHQDWVELIDPQEAQWGRVGQLLRVNEVNREDMTVTVHLPITPLRPYREGMVLRRWDHRNATVGTDGAIPLNKGNDVEIEEGIRVCFASDGNYVPGTYWLIPARAAIRDILWERNPDPKAGPADAAFPLPPHGPAHHYAPLALANIDNTITDVRREMKSIVTQL